MDADTPLIFTSSRWTLGWIANADGTACVFPTLADETGLYFPFEQALASIGGKAVYSWRDHSYDITLDGVRRHITADGVVTEQTADGTWRTLGDDFVILLPFSETYTLLYTRAEQLTQYLGITWTYDAAQKL